MDRTTNLAYGLDGYLWAISTLAAEKIQIRCVMETHIITIKPPLQIVDVGNGCKAFSASIYIPAESELTATLQSITRSQFFLDHNINYINVSNFLVWCNFCFAELMETEIKTIKAKMLQLLPMHMDMFNNIIHNIDEDYPFSLSPTNFGFISNCGHMCNCPRNNIHMVQKESYLFLLPPWETWLNLFLPWLVILHHWTHCYPCYPNLPLLELNLEPPLLLLHIRLHLMNALHHMYWYQGCKQPLNSIYINCATLCSTCQRTKQQEPQVKVPI